LSQNIEITTLLCFTVWRNHTGHSFRRSGVSIAAAVEYLSQKRWIKYGRLLLSVSIWLNFVLNFNVLLETLSETGANICTLSTYYTDTVQFIAVYANTSVQFDEGTQLLPNFGLNTYICTNVCKTTPLYNGITSNEWYFHKLTIIWEIGKLLLPVCKINDKKCFRRRRRWIRLQRSAVSRRKERT
jgi:hypothetical protein